MNDPNNKIVPFDFQGHAVRVIDCGDHEEWIAKDVCEALGVTRADHSLDGLDDDEKGKVTVLEPDSANTGSGGIPRTYSTVTEPGLYKLILRSRKPVAKVFARFVAHDVLPQIRRKGYYVPAGHEERVARELVTQLEAQGRLLTQQSQSIVLLNSQIVSLQQHMAALDRPNGWVSPAEDAAIRGGIQQIAVLRAQLSREDRLPIAWYREVDHQVRSLVGYPTEAGAKWAVLPARMFGEVMSTIAKLSSVEEKRIKRISGKAKRAQRKSQQVISFPKTRRPRSGRPSA